MSTPPPKAVSPKASPPPRSTSSAVAKASATGPPAAHTAWPHGSARKLRVRNAAAYEGEHDGGAAAGPSHQGGEDDPVGKQQQALAEQLAESFSDIAQRFSELSTDGENDTAPPHHFLVALKITSVALSVDISDVADQLRDVAGAPLVTEDFEYAGKIVDSFFMEATPPGETHPAFVEVYVVFMMYPQVHPSTLVHYLDLVKHRMPVLNACMASVPRAPSVLHGATANAKNGTGESAKTDDILTTYMLQSHDSADPEPGRQGTVAYYRVPYVYGTAWAKVFSNASVCKMLLGCAVYTQQTKSVASDEPNTSGHPAVYPTARRLVGYVAEAFVSSPSDGVDTDMDDPADESGIFLTLNFVPNATPVPANAIVDLIDDLAGYDDVLNDCQTKSPPAHDYQVLATMDPALCASSAHALAAYGAMHGGVFPLRCSVYDDGSGLNIVRNPPFRYRYYVLIKTEA